VRLRFAARERGWRPDSKPALDSTRVFVNSSVIATKLICGLKSFLAHGSEDKELADLIALSLRSRDHIVFLDDDDLPPGINYNQQIERAIKASDIFVFLISPDSVREGRYTLSELKFARQRWPNPNGRLLPVMGRKTPLENIPAYLKSVTILKPQGDIAAETSATVDNMRTVVDPVPRGLRNLNYGNIALGLGALLAVAAVLAYFYVRGFPINTTDPNVNVTKTSDSYPYGIYLTGVTDPQKAAREAEKVRSIAQSIGRAGNEIRLYKRMRMDGTYLWAIVIVYTSPDAASGDIPKYEPAQNAWDQNPDVVNIRSWCPRSRSIPSPTGSAIQFPTLDCT
jgi:hypothetical protein